MSDSCEHPGVACPRCGRMLEADGELSLPGVFIDRVHDDDVLPSVPVYQCEDCIVEREIFGPGTEKFRMCLTFIIGPDGKAYDPTDMREVE